MQFNIIYIPIGVPTFHLESAQREFEKSKELLKSIDDNTVVPEEMLLSTEKLNGFISCKAFDLAVVQNVTFANSAYIAEVLRKLSCPVLLWSLPEPVIDGGRLRLNSLTGAFSAANTICSFKRKFEYIHGSPCDEETKNSIASFIKAVKVQKSLRELRILQVGHTPQGFGFGRAGDNEIMTVFGSEVVSIEARELIDKAKSYSVDEVKAYFKDASERINGLNKIDGRNVTDFAKLYKAYADFVRENNIKALSSRCWPDFFTSFGTPVCAVLGILNDLGVASACEADTFGALSMYISSELTGKPSFFGDPVSLDEKENTVTFWHCGTAACSLARENTGACAGVHCNRKIGPTLEFGCKKEEKVTVFRVGKASDGKFRFFISSGEALDKPQQFTGTSVVVKTDNSARDIILSAVSEGWEPHFAVAMGDISREIKALGKLLDVEVCEF